MSARIRRRETWTKHCDNGAKCLGSRGSNVPTPYFVPDDQDICDPCLKAEYDLWSHITYDSLDHLGMVDLVPLDYVLKIIRKLRENSE